MGHAQPRRPSMTLIIQCFQKLTVPLRICAVNEREELLNSFASCVDSQRAWLLLEDYFEKHALSRKDFPATDWWPRVLSAQGKSRLEELAFLFLRAKRSMPTELS